jgi:hypothetical protein
MYVKRIEDVQTEAGTAALCTYCTGCTGLWYCSTSDRWHCHLRVLVQQDIDLHHLPCFEDLTKAITLHVV